MRGLQLFTKIGTLKYAGWIDILRDRWSEYKLDASQRPRIIYEYFVSGKGEFPFDMLRYDACWPMTGEDADKLDTPYGSAERIKMRSIRMRSYRQPTIARWQSFLWAVGTENL